MESRLLYENSPIFIQKESLQKILSTLLLIICPHSLAVAALLHWWTGWRATRKGTSGAETSFMLRGIKIDIRTMRAANTSKSPGIFGSFQDLGLAHHTVILLIIGVSQEGTTIPLQIWSGLIWVNMDNEAMQCLHPLKE